MISMTARRTWTSELFIISTSIRARSTLPERPRVDSPSPALLRSARISDSSRRTRSDTTASVPMATSPSTQAVWISMLSMRDTFPMVSMASGLAMPASAATAARATQRFSSQTSSVIGPIADSSCQCPRPPAARPRTLGSSWDNSPRSAWQASVRAAFM